MANVIGSQSKKQMPKKKRDVLVALARKNKSAVWTKVVAARADILKKAIKNSRDKKFAKAVQDALLK